MVNYNTYLPLLLPPTSTTTYIYYYLHLLLPTSTTTYPTALLTAPAIMPNAPTTTSVCTSTGMHQQVERSSTGNGDSEAVR